MGGWIYLTICTIDEDGGEEGFFFLCFGRLGMGVFFDVVGWVSGDGGFLA